MATNRLGLHSGPIAPRRDGRDAASMGRTPFQTQHLFELTQPLEEAGDVQALRSLNPYNRWANRRTYLPIFSKSLTSFCRANYTKGVNCVVPRPSGGGHDSSPLAGGLVRATFGSADFSENNLGLLIPKKES
jgi:hypothetical protein